MKSLRILPLVLILCLLGARDGVVTLTAQDKAKEANAAGSVAGMYTFLKEGEFVQLTVDDGKLSGYISHFGESDSDRGEFIDQFFDKTSLVGDRLTFNTKTIHGLWYDFNGRVSIVPGKAPDSEGYRVMKGILVKHTTDDKGQESAQQRDVEFKSFPADLGRP
jgi:hypothetical protein